jgi:hypothetical protein
LTTTRHPLTRGLDTGRLRRHVNHADRRGPALGAALLSCRRAGGRAAERARAMPRLQLSCRGWRTTASTRRCTSGVGGPGGNRRAIASLRHRLVPRSPERSSGLDRPGDRNARRAMAGVVEPLAAPLPRTRPSSRGWADDCIAWMMRKSNHVRSPSDAALLLIGHPGSCLDRRRGRACLLLALVGGPTKDQPLPAVVRCREAATGRSPG